MTTPTLPPDYVLTFGKYQGEHLDSMLADTRYCWWLMRQDFVKAHHPALHARVQARLAEVQRLRGDFAGTGVRKASDRGVRNG